MLKSSSEVRSIQYLRAVAAISVLFFHVSEAYGLGFKVGAAGVDIFFVISGFIMWVTTCGRAISPRNFMMRRISRIVPLYWIVTLMTFVIASIRPQFFFAIDISPQNLAGSLLFLPLIRQNTLDPVVVQGWTLSYEIFFYLIFAVSLVLDEARRFWFLVLFLVLIVAAHFGLPAGYARVFTAPVILEFAAGVAIGYLWTQGWRMPFGVAIALLIGGFLLMAAFYLMRLHFDRALLWGLPAALILSGAVFAERERGTPKLSFLHFLGDASYSIYIWHVLISVLLTALLLRIGVSSSVQPILLVASSLVVSLACYMLVERPLLRMLHPPRRKLAQP